MNGKQLKNSILQLAIQGKLVPQDPNDEPSSKLLERIRKEKEQLVKEGKLKKKDLVSEPITDEEKPFEIPESWEWCRLGEICTFLSRGKSPKYSDVPNQYPVFAQKCNLKDGGISLEQARFLDPNTIDKWQEIYKLKTDDILVNSTGTGTVCRTRLFHENYLGQYSFTVPDSHVTVVRTFAEISSAFYYYIFNSKHIQDYWEERLAGSTNQKELYIGTIQETIIPLPPLSEQHRIVAKIEELMPLVEEYDQAQTKLNALNEKLPDALKKSILQEAIQGKLVPQDPNDEPASKLLERIRKEKEQLVKEGKLKKKDLVSEPIADEDKPFDIPESWAWCRLGDIGSWGAGATPAKGKPEFYTNGNIPWLRTGELNNDYVYDSEIKVTQTALDYCSLRMCRKGDVLIAMYGATIGKVAIAGIELTTNQACCACTPIQIFNEYLMWYLMASKQSFIELGEGGAQPNISREKIVAFPFAVPPLAEQHRIVAKIEELFGTLK